ncbi:MAG: 2OG-Fe(II) oxygenase [Tardiphaga sp.]|jgi:PKHD-type hydroxylase|nr:2OG-Fe(II) oxygenase [Tardiphaga sp.]
MLIHIPEVLTPDQVRYFREVMERADWVNGALTAGHQAIQVKNNLQLPDNTPEAQELSDLVLAAVSRHPLFMSAALPNKIYPPMFNRYDADGAMNFGAHVDNAIRIVPGTATRVRTDVSSTLFLSSPDEYDGGELVVEDTYGTHSVKLPAGDMVVYPGTSLHLVTPVTRGARIGSFFWTQSLISDVTRRAMMFDLDMSIIRLNGDHPEHPSVVSLTALYHNLLRQWSET